MQVTCNACQRSMNILDEKLPKDQAFSIPCPGCKNKSKVDQHLKTPDPPTPPQQEEALDTAGMVVDQEEFEDDEYEDEEISDNLAYKVLSGSESKVERELNILSHEGWTIDKMSAFDSNNGTVLVIVISIIPEDSVQAEIDKANSLLYP